MARRGRLSVERAHRRRYSNTAAEGNEYASGGGFAFDSSMRPFVDRHGTDKCAQGDITVLLKITVPLEGYVDDVTRFEEDIGILTFGDLFVIEQRYARFRKRTSDDGHVPVIRIFHNSLRIGDCSD